MKGNIFLEMCFLGTLKAIIKWNIRYKVGKTHNLIKEDQQIQVINLQPFKALKKIVLD